MEAITRSAASMKASASFVTHLRNPRARNFAGPWIPTTGKTYYPTNGSPTSAASRIPGQQSPGMSGSTGTRGQCTPGGFAAKSSPFFSQSGSRQIRPRAQTSNSSPIRTRRVLHQFNEAFEQHRRVIASLFEPHGCEVTAISRYPLPKHLPPHNKYAALTALPSRRSAATLRGDSQSRLS